MFNNRFAGANVLVTGHTGFKGSWLTTWLLKLGANVTGIGLDPNTSPSLFSTLDLGRKITDRRIDVRDSISLDQAVQQAQPDFIFHLAAQALVRESYHDPQTTWSTNVMGTVNLLTAVQKLKKSCSVIIVTSDKCYHNNEWPWGYRETDELGGHDPYSASKAATELVTRSFTHSYFMTPTSLIRVGSVRAGNVIGGGDWSPDRIVPDCVKAWARAEMVVLRNPNATRPWQHVLEPLSGYLCLASRLAENATLNGEPFNFGPTVERTVYTVGQLVEVMSRAWPNARFEIELPTDRNPHEAALLQLNCDKAMSQLKWASVLDFENTVNLTADWYRQYYENSKSIFELTTQQISQYEKRAQDDNLQWTM